jgi:hypothetical protein
VAFFNGFSSEISLSINKLLSIGFVSSREYSTESFSSSWWFSYGVSSSVNGRSSFISFEDSDEELLLSTFIGVSSIGSSAAGISFSSISRCVLKFYF